MKDTEACIEAGASQRDRQLTSENAVEVIQDGVCRGDRVASVLPAKRGVAAAKTLPVLRRLLPACETKRHVHPQGPVCRSSGAFDAQQLHGICGVIELRGEINDELGYLATAEQASNGGLSDTLCKWRSFCATV